LVFTLFYLKEGDFYVSIQAKTKRALGYDKICTHTILNNHQSGVRIKPTE
jgi:hypothetical protein